MILLLVTDRLALCFITTNMRTRNLSRSEIGSRMLRLDQTLLLLRVVRVRLSPGAGARDRRRLVHLLSLHWAWCGYGRMVGAGILRLGKDVVHRLGLLGLDRTGCWERALGAELGRDWPVVKTG